MKKKLVNYLVIALLCLNMAMSITAVCKYKFIEGPRGIQGETGSQGIPGVAGKDGKDGADGRGIVSITKTSSTGLVDIYTITYTDNTTSTFTITNGKDGENGADGADGYIETSTGTVIKYVEKSQVDLRGMDLIEESKGVYKATITASNYSKYSNLFIFENVKVMDSRYLLGNFITKPGYIVQSITLVNTSTYGLRFTSSSSAVKVFNSEYTLLDLPQVESSSKTYTNLNEESYVISGISTSWSRGFEKLIITFKVR